MKTLTNIAIATTLIIGTLQAGTPPGCYPCRSKAPVTKGKPLVKKSIK